MDDTYVTVNITDKEGVLLDSFRVLVGRERAKTAIELANSIRNTVEMTHETQKD